MSPGSLSDTSFSVFVAVTFDLLGFCIPGTLGFTRQCVLYIYIILCIYISFLQYLFCCNVFWGQQPDYIPASYIVRPCFFLLICYVLQCILQCNVKYCSALQCSLQSFHCSLLTFLIFLFYPTLATA